MNHDYAHCLDYTKDCPKDCFRAELQRDIEENRSMFIGVPLAYSHLRDTEECKLVKEKKMDDTISRKAAIKYLMTNMNWYDEDGYETDDDYKRECITALINGAPSAQRWIPIKTRPMDEEERAEWSEKLGYDIEYEEAVIYTSQLPDDGQEVLTCSRYGTIRIDKFENDPDYGCSFEENGDMDGIVAWMPLPEPWKGGEG